MGTCKSTVKMAKAPQKSKEAKAKAASGGGKKSKKKWSKGKVRDKLANACVFDQATYDKVMKEVPNYKVITPSIVDDGRSDDLVVGNFLHHLVVGGLIEDASVGELVSDLSLGPLLLRLLSP